jgi:hypothetical protein
VEVTVISLVLVTAVALVTLLLWNKLPKEPGAEGVESLVVPVTYSGSTFVVVNPTDGAWSDVELDLNRMGRLPAGYRYTIASLGPHQAASIEAPAFVGADGRHFDPRVMPPTTMFMTMQLADGRFGTSLYRFK